MHIENCCIIAERSKGAVRIACPDWLPSGLHLLCKAMQLANACRSTNVQNNAKWLRICQAFTAAMEWVVGGHKVAGWRRDRVHVYDFDNKTATNPSQHQGEMLGGDQKMAHPCDKQFAYDPQSTNPPANPLSTHSPTVVPLATHKRLSLAAFSHVNAAVCLCQFMCGRDPSPPPYIRVCVGCQFLRFCRTQTHSLTHIHWRTA